MRYLMGHLRGAVSVPFKKLQGTRRTPGATRATGRRLRRRPGLGDDVTPVLYDHQDGRNAAMAAFVLEYLGRDDVHIMDLLYDAWKEQGREVLYRPVSTEARSFTVSLNPALRATLDDAANPGNAVLLDNPNRRGVQRRGGNGPPPRPYPRRHPRAPPGNGRQ